MADIEAIQDKLMEAHAKGVPQCTGWLTETNKDGDTSYCALGWLHTTGQYPLGMDTRQAIYLVKANDAGADWLTLARKLPEILSGEWQPEANGG